VKTTKGVETGSGVSIFRRASHCSAHPTPKFALEDRHRNHIDELTILIDGLAMPPFFAEAAFPIGANCAVVGRQDIEIDAVEVQIEENRA